MTPERLSELKALVEKSVSGPWEVRPEYPDEPVYTKLVVNKGDDGYDCLVAENVREPDAEFIAAARTALPELIAEVERLRTIEKAANAEPGEHTRWTCPGCPRHD